MADAIDALYQDLINTEQIQGKIREKATSLGVDPALALAVAHQESGFNGCDRAIPNPNLLIKSFAHKIKHLLKNIVLLYSPGFYANTLDVGL